MKICTAFYNFRFFIVLIYLAFPSNHPLSAAPREAVVKLYHGTAGIDALHYDTDGTQKTTSLTTLSLPLPAGTVVKVMVENANTYYYTYGIDTVHLQPRDDFPDISSITSIIKPLLQKTADSGGSKELNSSHKESKKHNDSTSKNEDTSPILTITDYMDKLDALKASIDTAKYYIGLSDTPQSFENIKNGQQSSLAQQQTKVRSFDKKEFGFNSPDLKVDLEKLYISAKESIISFEKAIGKTNTGYMEILDLIQERGKLLLATRDKLRSEFMAAKDRVVLTVIVPKNGTDIKLHIAPRDSTFKARKTGKELFTVSVTTPYDRPLVELAPIAFAVMPFSNASSFSIVDSVVTKSSNTKINFGIGTMILFNLLPIADNQFNVGLGLGVGLSPTESPILTEYLLGFSVSYIDKARLGFGIGWSYLPDHLKTPIVEGKPLPPDAGDLEDLIEKTYKPSFFITFSFPGLNLPL